MRDRSTELLVRARREPEALGELVDERYDDVFRICMSATEDDVIAAELTAETFAAVVRDLHRFDPAATLGEVWIENIARNQVRHWSKRGVVDSRARRRLGVAIPGSTSFATARDRV